MFKSLIAHHNHKQNFFKNDRYSFLKVQNEWFVFKNNQKRKKSEFFLFLTNGRKQIFCD